MTHSATTTAQDSSVGGGPRTVAGKDASRRNAVKHGLAAKQREIFDRQVVDQCYERLCEEFLPDAATEEYLVREMARHQAAANRCEEMELAVLRRGASGAPEIAFGDCSETELLDAALAGAGTSDALERIARYRRAHENGYFRSLAALLKLRGRATAKRESTSRQRRRLFDSEASCEAYLVARFLADGSPCPHCAGSSGKWIATRNVWQCCKCRKQVSVRADTVMARSRLKLLTWFLVIETLLQNPAASTAELATASGIRRAGTVRRMATRIRQAMNCPERSALLAGLDRLLGAANDSPAEPSVSD